MDAGAAVSASGADDSAAAAEYGESNGGGVYADV